MSILVSAEWIVLSFDTPYYTELPPPIFSPKTEIENWVICLYLLPNPLNYCLYFATWKLLNKYCLNQSELFTGSKTQRKTLWIRPEPYTEVWLSLFSAWFSVSIRGVIYWFSIFAILNTAFAACERTGSRKPNKSHQFIGCHYERTQTDRPKSVRNCCVY